MTDILISIAIALLLIVIIMLFAKKDGSNQQIWQRLEQGEKSTKEHLSAVVDMLISSQSKQISSMQSALSQGQENTRQATGSDLQNIQKALMEYVDKTYRQLGEISDKTQENLEKNRKTIEVSLEKQRQENENKLEQTRQATGSDLQNIQKALMAYVEKTSQQLVEISDKTQENLEKNRKTIEVSLEKLRQENENKLEQMRVTVNEKLQKTLEGQISQSFRIVSERLEQVYKGLGEMQQLASGVGDLKRVLSNVKTRGILGEIQLKAIIEDILSPGQYIENAKTKKNSPNVVEFAIKLPASQDGFVLLPIDSKFPADTYSALLDAYDSLDKAQIEKAKSALVQRLKQEAKDISTKYIEVPQTTEFAILFLPFEGLYAEAVNLGMVETLQREFKVTIAGPTTMAAIINSLQMGFRTLEIQKRSAEVWAVLENVKGEFDRFSDALLKTQTRMQKAQEDLETLVGVRSRKMQMALSKIGTVNEIEDKQDFIENIGK